MNVLELYSGIGGMHQALDASTLDFNITRAFDINELANAIYNYNFGPDLAMNKMIESLTENDLRHLAADLWLMSPPCQPFTRDGNRKHGSDCRCNSFVKIIGLISIIKPKFILIENVKGFEYSDVWNDLITTLWISGYKVKQFLLTPLQFGIPNCRLRYYLTATLDQGSMETFAIQSLDSFHIGDVLNNFASKIFTTPSIDVPALPGCSCPVCTGESRHISSIENHYEAYLEFCQPLSGYLLEPTKVPESLWLTEDKVQRWSSRLNIVSPTCRKSSCFTKGYAKRFIRSGSFLSFNNHIPRALGDSTSAIVDQDQEHGLRYFHSVEISKLLGLSPKFVFPPNITEYQRLRLLGNSINVVVVAHILYWSFRDIYQ